MTESIAPKVAVEFDALDSAEPNSPGAPPLILTADLSLFYGKNQALKNISLGVREKVVTAFIGPSGCGKSTLLRCFNRMNDLIDGVRTEGLVEIAGQNINSREVDVIELRKRVGMVFQRSNPFLKSIYENIAYALRLHGTKSKSHLDDIIEKSLRQAALWEEVKDRLHTSALGLSGGNSSDFALRAPLPLDPKSFLWMSRRRLSIQSPRPRSRN